MGHHHFEGSLGIPDMHFETPEEKKHRTRRNKLREKIIGKISLAHFMPKDLNALLMLMGDNPNFRELTNEDLLRLEKRVEIYENN